MIYKNDFLVTVITPTIGRQNLDKLIQSIENQSIGDKIFHILMWDEVKEISAWEPEMYNDENRISIVLPWSLGKNGNAPGSALRSVAMMAAFTPFVTFGDDDVFYDDDHFETMLSIIENNNWAYCRRKVYDPITKECFGVDNFESVGDSSDRKVSYEMVDGNCMMFRREFGVMAAPLYRETLERNDDRLLYAFLKQHGGIPGKSVKPTVNQYAPEFLIDFFKNNCTK